MNIQAFGLRVANNNNIAPFGGFNKEAIMYFIKCQETRTFECALFQVLEETGVEAHHCVKNNDAFMEELCRFNSSALLKKGMRERLSVKEYGVLISALVNTKEVLEYYICGMGCQTYSIEDRIALKKISETDKDTFAFVMKRKEVLDHLHGFPEFSGSAYWSSQERLAAEKAATI